MSSSISILSWNIRGLNNSVALRNLRDHITDNRATIFCIQETKIECCPSKQLEDFACSKGFEIVFQPSTGLSGGLVTGWDSKLVKCVALAQDTSWIWNCFVDLRVGGRMHVVNIYSPLHLDKKRKLWHDLKNIIVCSAGEAVCFIGDFNCVRSARERLNCVYKSLDSKGFNELIVDLNLSDLPLVNSEFTWFGPSKKKSKLDRALVNYAWFSIGIWSIKALCKKHSDHRPILLASGSSLHPPRPFKVFNCYLTDSLLEKVKQSSSLSKEWEGKNLQSILKEIKVLIKNSSYNSASQLDKDIKALEKEVDIIDSLNNPEVDSQELKDKLQLLYHKRDSMIKQKSRIQWLLKGDGNNKFFHQAIQRRICSNSISKLFWKDRWLVDHDQIRVAFYEYFSNFFQVSHIRLISLGVFSLPKLRAEERARLVCRISPSEIEAALHSLADNKAPGPDGMNIKSMKFLWPCIRSKVIQFVDDFWNSGLVPSGVNSSFITLIPKVSQPTLVKDFRPISLINSSIKILTKVLALRLASHMENLISDAQSGFVKGRQSSEGIWLIKEVAHLIQKRRCKGAILKLDFEKAFDTVNWNFLLEVMEYMNFDQKWCRWIQALLHSVRISVLVNGIPSKEFAPLRGLRQGDPISPLLFNIVGQVLSSMISTAAKKGIFKGISLGNDTEQITHLQFADDTVVFLDGSAESARGIKQVLQIFQLISGLKINFSKSNLYSSKFGGANLDVLAKILNCGIGKWPFSYLGMPIGISAKKRLFWEPLVSKLKNKLAQWKVDSLNQAGRLTLVKSVLDSTPVYWMNLHRIPSLVAKQIDRIRRDFFWGHGYNSNNQSRKLHLISWSKICKPKKLGGLGLSTISHRNLALLGKWYYKWECDRNKSWNKWIRSKYGLSKHCGLSECKSSNNMSDSMQAVLSVSQSPLLKNKVSKDKFRWSLANGKMAFFWEDVWLLNEPLKLKFRRLFNLSKFKEFSVLDFIKASQGKSIKLPMFWTRPLRSWEMEEAEYLDVLIKQVILTQEEDSISWSFNNKPYAVSKAMELISGIGEEISWYFIWKLRIPHKIKLFLWKVHLNIIPTSSFLIKRGIGIASKGLCAFCDKEDESLEHLFFQCQVAKQFWLGIFAWWGVNFVQQNMIHMSALWNASSYFPSKSLKSAWKITISASLWSLWLSRNQCIFDSKGADIKNMLSLTISQASDWCQVQNLLSKELLLQWNHSPVSAISNAEGNKFKELLACGSQLIGFCDGSWKRNSVGFKAGIGGLIFKSSGEAILSFFGPSLAATSFDSEWEALSCLREAFLGSEWSKCQLTIFTDSRQVFCNFLENSLKFHQSAASKENAYLNCQNIRVKVISSEHNTRADFLAKKGAKSKELKLFWVHKRGD